MSAFALSPEADEDVWSIWLYLAREAGVSVANHVEGELFEAFKTPLLRAAAGALGVGGVS